MPLRFFRKENSSAARRERQEQIEKAIAEGLRRLSDLFKRSAELIEAQRLSRGGYEKQEKYLERVAPPSKSTSDGQTGQR
ncbi:MAG: hypothetical protein QM817_19900 [Archangium sp.]